MEMALPSRSRQVSAISRSSQSSAKRLALMVRIRDWRLYAVDGTGGLTPPEPSVHDPCMAVKTITIDLEAYEALARHKREGESFSQVIKSHFGRTRTGRGLKEILRQAAVSDATVDRIEAVVRSRRRSPVKVPKL